MADARTRLIMEAIDKASKVVAAVGDAVAKSGKHFKSLAEEIPGLNQAMSLLTNPVALAGAGIAAAGKYAADATKETLDYNRQIRDLAQNLNRSTMETSRIVQTMDDFGVSQDSVTASLEMALKNGFAPSIETIARMADEYNKIQDPTERATKLNEVFGKSWADLVPALKQGGDAIRAGAAAQNDAMLVTQEAAQAVTDYDKALDELNDTFTVTKRVVGNTLIPPLTKLTNGLNDLVEFQNLWNEASKRGIRSQAAYATQSEDLATNVASLTKLIEDYDKAQKDQFNTVVKLTVGTEDLTKEEVIRNWVLGQAVGATNNVVAATKELAKVTDEEIAATNKNFADMLTELNKIYDVNFSDVDFGLASAVKNSLDAMKLEAAGGGGWDDAVRQVMHLHDTGALSDQVTTELLTAAEVGFEQAKVRAGLQNVWEGASNLAETLRIPQSKAYELITGPVMDELDYINSLTAYVWVGVRGPGAGYVDTVAAAANVTDKNGNVLAEVRAEGGPVSAGQPYWVGDGGEPELFVPNQSGTIIPQHDMPAGGGGMTLNFYGVTNAREIAQLVGRELDRRR